jgi:hypothetical protein
VLTSEHQAQIIIFHFYFRNTNFRKFVKFLRSLMPIPFECVASIKKELKGIVNIFFNSQLSMSYQGLFYHTTFSQFYCSYAVPLMVRNQRFHRYFKFNCYIFSGKVTSSDFIVTFFSGTMIANGLVCPVWHHENWGEGLAVGHHANYKQKM